MAAFFVLVGHYMDHYVMIMPGTVEIIMDLAYYN